ncbi:MAG: hypothetical protein U0703_00390 [Anaerolineae bacterium]
MRPVVRRHRLPHPYRLGLTVLWVTPLLLFVGVIALKRGVDLALLDPRFLLPALLMIVPAVYFWREGIDVLPDGIVRRIHLPCYIPFAAMARWHYDRRPDRHVLTIWDTRDQKIVECRAGHLTDFPMLLETLEDRLR